MRKEIRKLLSRKTNKGQRRSFQRLLLRYFDPEKEAKSFYGMVKRGGDIERVRADIDVPGRTIEIWQNLKAAGDQTARIAVDRLLPLRKKTLRLFNHLVKNYGRLDFS